MDFLQSVEWRKFQESAEHKTFFLESENFHTSIIEHKLPLVGRYFYIPRGPVVSWNMEHGAWNEKIQELINLAKKEKASWIRIEPENEKILNLIKKNTPSKIVKAPHDMQPKEVFVINIAKTEEELLKEMKSKTRYNIKLAQKKNITVINDQGTKNNKYIEEFLRINRIMAKRQGIKTHDENYYRKMFEVIPNEMIKLYVAEYDTKIIAANIVIFYGDTCAYLHGASDDEYKNLMAPYLLQWQAILDAKKQGCAKYDFGGVKINDKAGKSWGGITRFKLGFSPNTSPTTFPGCFDIIINPWKYWAYRFIQKMKNFI